MAEEKSNPVWQYFTEPTSEKAKCNICQKLLSVGAEKAKTKNTTNMWNHHLKVHHLQAYKDSQKDKDAAASAPNLLQPTVVQMNDSQKKWQNTDPGPKNVYPNHRNDCYRQPALYSHFRY